MTLLYVAVTIIIIIIIKIDLARWRIQYAKNMLKFSVYLVLRSFISSVMILYVCLYSEFHKGETLLT